MTVDALDLDIIRKLNSGVMSPKVIADELNSSYNTVRRRLKRLEKNEVIKIKGSINADKIPNHFLGLVCLNFNTRDLQKRAEEISKLDGVISVAIVTGRFDLVVLVLLNEKNNLYNFNIKQMSKIEGITFSETFVMYRNINWEVPYVL